MSKIKGINKVTRQLNIFLKDNGFKCKAFSGNEWQFWVSQNKIEWSLVVAEKHDKMFKKLCFDLGLKYDCDIFILNLFHELGHYCTQPLMTSALESRYCDEIDYFSTKKDLTDEDIWNYYNLYEEKMATRWAVRYINDNAKKIKVLWGILQPKILEIYKINNIEDD